MWDTRQLNRFLAVLLPQAGEILAEPPLKRRAGIRSAIPEDLEHAMPSPADPQVYMITRGSAAEYRREQEFAKKLAALTPPVAVKDANALLGAMRRVKSQRELDILKHAVDITAEAFQRAYALGVPGTPEYEIQAQFEFTFLRRNAHWGYPCIVASGRERHHPALRNQPGHDEGRRPAADGRRRRVRRLQRGRDPHDPGERPVLQEQAEIYRLVWEAQQAGIRMALPGHTSAGNPTSIQGAANEVFKQGLFRMGLITDPDSDQQMRIWFNHGISHGIGLNVHDPGRTRISARAWSITVEPGIYFRPDALDNLPKTPENEKFIAAVQAGLREVQRHRRADRGRCADHRRTAAGALGRGSVETRRSGSLHRAAAQRP